MAPVDNPFEVFFDLVPTGAVLYAPVFDADGEVVDFRFVRLNPAGQRLLGLPAQPTATFREQYPHSGPTGIFAQYRTAYLTGEAATYDVPYVGDGLDTFFRLVAQRSGELLVVNFTDLADLPRSAVEQSLRESQAREQAARAEAEAQRQRFYDVLMQLPAQVAIYHGPDHVYQFVNARFSEFVSQHQLLGHPLREVAQGAVSAEVFEVFDRVYATGEPAQLRELEVVLDRYQSGRAAPLFVDAFYLPLRDGQGRIYGVVDFSYDVTEQVRARWQVEQLNQELEARVQERTREVQAARAEAEAQRQLLQSVLTQAPVAIGVFQGEDLVVTQANDRLCAMWGYEPAQVLGRPLLEGVPELRGQGFDELLREVGRTYIPFAGSEMPAALRQADGRLEAHYFNFVYQPLYGPAGELLGVLDIATDVTKQVEAHQQAAALQAEVLAAAQRQAAERETFYQVFEQTPAAICIQRGPEHRYEYVNPTYQALFVNRVFPGRTLAEALPETIEQGFVALLDGVYRTGETFRGTELPVVLHNAAGEPERTIYFNFTYQAFREDGAIVGISTFAYDVTEQVLAKQQREQQQRKLYTLFEQAPTGICILAGPNLVYEFFNPVYQQLVPGRVLLGNPILESLPELAGTPIVDILRSVYDTGETREEHDLLIQVRRPDGHGLEDRYFTAVYQARRDEHQRVDGVMAFTFEVTEQVRARRKVEESEQQVRAVVEGAPFLIGVYVGPEFRIQLANQAMLEAMGKGPDVLGQRYVDVLPELENQAVFAQLDQVWTTGQPLHQRNQRLEVVMDGTQQTFYYNYSFTPLHDTQGRVYGILNTAADVTDLAQARQRLEVFATELQESETRFRIVADTAPNMVWDLNPDGSVRYVNKYCLEFLGITLAEFVAHNWGPYLLEEDVAPTQQLLTQAIQERTLFNMEHRMRRHDGQYRWLQTQGGASYYPNGELYGYVGSAIDITDLKQANEQLRRTNVDLDNFIYTASHDLKQPIANIEGLLLALQHELPSAGRVGEVPTMLHLMQQAVERFGRTIGHLTDVSRLQQAHSQPLTQVDLARVVQEVQLDLAPLIAQTAAQVVVAIPKSTTLLFSEKNLRSVIYNLFSNAIKYRYPDRPPVVHLTYQPEAKYQVLEVTDNGLGLDLRQGQDKLFAMFQRLHTHVEGTGIGLYMVKKMVENAGGRIEVHSELGQGSTFRVYFPR